MLCVWVCVYVSNNCFVVKLNTSNCIQCSLKAQQLLPVCYTQRSISTLLYVVCYQSVTRNSNNISGYVYNREHTQISHSPGKFKFWTVLRPRNKSPFYRHSFTVTVTLLAVRQIENNSIDRDHTRLSTHVIW